MKWNEITSLSERKAFLPNRKRNRFYCSGTYTVFTLYSALSRFERKWKAGTESQLNPYLVNLIEFRQVSNAIADKTGVKHESPQVILIFKGIVLYHASHNGIYCDEMIESLNAASICSYMLVKM